MPSCSLLVFDIDGVRYALNTSVVQRCYRVPGITPLPRAPGIIAGVVQIAGTPVPVLDVRARFGHPPRAPRLSDHLIVALKSSQPVALYADEVVGQRYVTTDDVTEAHKVVRNSVHLDGIACLPDGLILIQNLDRFLDQAESEELEAALGAPEERKAP